MAKIILNPLDSLGQINRNIYGHFSEHLGRCIYQGLYVGPDSAVENVRGMRTAAVEALKKIRIPVLRWPGGCFADEYHWEDGIGPQSGRRRMVNTHWGGVVEDNSFGTHEFLDLCEMLGCEPDITANVGSGTIRELSEWVEYINSPSDSSTAQRRWANGRRDPWSVKYWGIGNESWGCGGNMRAEYYADVYRRYQTYCRQYTDVRPYKIACGPSDSNYEWMQTLMERAARYMDGISLHYYTVCNTWDNKSRATQFSTSEYYQTLKKALFMDELVTRHDAIMTRYDPEKRIGLVVDEWGTWHAVEPGTNPGFLYQQNTMRDALVASLTLDIFNRHCDRVTMANIAQTVNVLQAVILTEGDQIVLTPTYHVFDLYKEHQDARQIAAYVETDTIGEEEWRVPRISASASEKDGAITVTVSNLSESEPQDVTLEGFRAAAAEGRILTGKMDAFNDFGASPLGVQAMEGIALCDGKATFTLPPCSVAAVTLK